MISICENNNVSSILLEQLACNAVYYDCDDLVKGFCNFIDSYDLKYISECDNILSENQYLLFEDYSPFYCSIISQEKRDAAKDLGVDLDLFIGGLNAGATQKKKVKDFAREYSRGSKKGFLHKMIEKIGNSKVASFLSRGLSTGIKKKLAEKGMKYAVNLVSKGRKNITKGANTSQEGLMDYIYGAQSVRDNPRRTKFFSVLGLLSPIMVGMPVVRQVGTVQKLMDKIPLTASALSRTATATASLSKGLIFGRLNKNVSKRLTPPKYRMAAGHTKAIKGGKQVALGKYLYKQFKKFK